MQVIIPMTGHGSRFVAAGYKELKPFIKVHGKPMLEWVVSMFPDDEATISFVCRQSHLDTIAGMEKELLGIAPQARIIAIDNWQKKGPVFDIMQVYEQFNEEQPILISYCDYYMHWDYAAFKRQVLTSDYAGAIPCYSGFHPHLTMPQNVYASCKVDAEENLIEIREKFCWTENKFLSRHSPGMYYFKTAAIFKRAAEAMFAAKEALNGEYYASLPYNYLVKAGLKVWCPINVSHFCQWGTPEDLQHYLNWADCFIK